MFFCPLSKVTLQGQRSAIQRTESKTTKRKGTETERGRERVQNNEEALRSKMASTT